MDRGNMIKDASVRKLLVFFVAVWFLLVVLRLAFAVWQWESLSVASWDDICYAFYIGAKFDGRIAVACRCPCFFYFFCLDCVPAFPDGAGESACFTA